MRHAGHRDPLDLALAEHRGGDLARTEAAYKRILASQPRKHGALMGLGLIAYQKGDYGAARALLFCTFGLASVDVRIADEIADPQRSEADGAIDRPWRLPAKLARSRLLDGPAMANELLGGLEAMWAAVGLPARI